MTTPESRDLAPLWTAIALAATLVALGGSITGSSGFGAGVLVGLVAGVAALLSETDSRPLRTAAWVAVVGCALLFVIGVALAVAG